jgi:hypothetical protein
MGPIKHALQCTTECREELLAMIGDCLTMKGLWKFLGIFVVGMIFILGVGGAIYENSQAGQNKQIEVNAAQTQVNTLTLIEVKKDLAYLKEGQQKMERDSQENFKALLKEIKSIRK